MYFLIWFFCNKHFNFIYRKICKLVNLSQTESESESVSSSIVSDSLQPMDCTRLLCPWNFQGRTMEWVAIPFSRGSPQPRDWTQVSHNAGKFFTIWATWEAHWIHFIILVRIQVNPVVRHDLYLINKPYFGPKYTWN